MCIINAERIAFLPQLWHSLAIGLALYCHRDGRVVPRLKKSLAHVEYFRRGLDAFFAPVTFADVKIGKDEDAAGIYNFGRPTEGYIHAKD